MTATGGPTDGPLLTVVIVTWNGRAQLERCLASLAGQDHPHRIVVVDNGSTDGTAAWLQDADLQLVALHDNTGFAAAANTGVALAATPWVVLLNDDARPRPGWLAALDAAARDAGPRVGILATKLLLAGTARIDSAGDLVDRAFIARPRGHGQPDTGRYDDLQPSFLAACGGAAGYRVEMWRDLAGFSAEFFAYFEDADLAVRAALRGWQTAFVPEAVADHDLSATSARLPGFKRYQGVRNSWWLLVRCVPAVLLPAALPGFLLTQLVWLAAAVRAREVTPVLRAYAGVLQALPRLVTERRAIQRGRVVPATQLWSRLEPVVELRRLTGRRPA